MAKGTSAHRSGQRAPWLLVLFLAAACSGATSSTSSVSGPAAPRGVEIETRGGAIRIDWGPVAGATAYKIYWSTALPVDAGDPSLTVAAPPLVVPDLSGVYHVEVSSLGAEGEGPPSATVSVTVDPPSPERYFPPWANVAPTTTLTIAYRSGETPVENGRRLMSLLNSLLPGDRVEIPSGVWAMDFAFRINAEGTAQAPIWISAASGATPVITRFNDLQNALELGVGGRARYLCLRGIEIRGGDIALRLHDCRSVWIDQCHIHDCAQNAIAANTLSVDALYFTRNEVHGTNGTGEGFYLGGNDSNPIASRCVVALNQVYDCRGFQGDGIEVKQGSWGNWIAENVVHDTNYPCILAGGTDGRAVNLIERNVCWRSGDNVMQVQGEAIVRNNVLFDGAIAFHSADHQGSTRNLVVVHNTFINEGLAANMASWGGRPGMVFANNACYSRFGTAIQFGSGSSGVQAGGNVAFGAVYGLSSGFAPGNGLADFRGASWDGSSRDVTPVPSGALAGAASAAWAELDQLSGMLRVPPFDTGAAEAP